MLLPLPKLLRPLLSTLAEELATLLVPLPLTAATRISSVWSARTLAATTVILISSPTRLCAPSIPTPWLHATPARSLVATTARPEAPVPQRSQSITAKARRISTRSAAQPLLLALRTLPRKFQPALPPSALPTPPLMSPLPRLLTTRLTTHAMMAPMTAAVSVPTAPLTVSASDTIASAAKDSSLTRPPAHLAWEVRLPQ
jgi:hypothetical protein